MDNNKYKLLQEWHQLLTEGVITQAEFNAKKQSLLGGSVAKPNNSPSNVQSNSTRNTQTDALQNNNGYLPTENAAPAQQAHSSNPPLLPSAPQNANVVYTAIDSEPPERKKPSWLLLSVALVLLIVAGALGSYFFYFKEKWIDEKAPRFFTTAKSTALRSSKVAGIDANFVTNVPFGGELITYANLPDWSEVKYNGQKGFISSKYIMSKPDFELLNNILADAVSKDAIESNKCRLALLDYVKRIETDSAARMNWKIFTKPKNTKPNSFFYPNRIVNPNSRFTDFAFVLTNVVTNQRSAALYSFSDDETQQFMFGGYTDNSGDIMNVVNNGLGEYSFYFK